MSYCRWSDDDFQSDVYAYARDDGYVVHVASRRRVLPPELRATWPTLPSFHDPSWASQYVARAKAQRLWLNDPNVLWVDLGTLPSAGQSFYEATLEDLLVRLYLLRTEGLNVPEHAIQAIHSEISTNET